MNLKQLIEGKREMEKALQALFDGIEPEANRIKDIISGYDEEIESLIAAPVKLRRDAEGKPYGIVNVEYQGVRIKHDQLKRVKWNEKKLASIVEQIKDSNADPGEYVKIKYSVEERKYTNWPKHIRDIFEPARTTDLGAVKVTFEIVEQEEAAAPAFPANVFPMAARR